MINVLKKLWNKLFGFDKNKQSTVKINTTRVKSKKLKSNEEKTRSKAVFEAKKGKRHAGLARSDSHKISASLNNVSEAEISTLNNALKSRSINTNKASKSSNELSKRISFRTTPLEHKAFSEKVNQQYLNNSSALRMLVQQFIHDGSQELMSVVDATDSQNIELSRIGNNLNQAVKAIHQYNKYQKGNVSNSLAQLDDTLTQLQQFFNRNK